MNANKKLKAAEVVIFNNEHFNDKNMNRVGSAKDTELLQKTFSKLKCDVKTIKDATLKEIRNTMNKLEKKNYEDRSALVLVILTHGQDYDLISEIIDPILRNGTLNDKPKILFIQACKGEKEVDILEAQSIPSLPSDVLMCFSTFEGFVSYRNEDGTHFIKALCETLRSRPSVDIQTNMEHVRILVKNSTRGAQVPSISSTMSSDYVFGDYV
ncbi:caspase-3 [Drosophila hydei]|uniref:Caspase-3 n=1 Tax=Drosophila hydei TaxID=7224 RepID=A0A6J1L5B7_DROHY|nr:caspase-3 [Drosophila hydei]